MLASIVQQDVSGSVILVLPAVTLFNLFLMCQLAHLSRIHQNRPKTSHVGDKVTKVVHLDEGEVVFSLDQICPPVNPLKPVLISLPMALGSRDMVGFLSNLICHLISLTPGPDDLPLRV